MQPGGYEYGERDKYVQEPIHRSSGTRSLLGGFESSAGRAVIG